MRTTISLPDELVAAADSLASRLGITRSELVATAVAEFVASHSISEVTACLDRVYTTEPSLLDPDLRRAQQRSLADDPW